MAQQKHTFRTTRSLEAIKPPAEGRVEHWDKDVKGLGLRVSSSGRKTWVLMYRVRGHKRLRRATLGTYPTLSLADARDQARDDLSAAAKGRDPAELRSEERQAETFSELAEDYMERYAKKYKRSWFKDRQHLDRDLLPRFRHRKAASIKRREVIALLEEIADRGAPVGANRTLEIIRRIYNWGIEQEIVVINPCQRIKKVGIERPRERVLSNEEIRSVWNAFDGETPRMRDLFRLRLLTAQRPGEVSRLRWEDIDLASGWWTIPPEFSKNGLTHRVPLSKPAIEVLLQTEGHEKKSGWVFPSPTGEGPLRSVWRAMDNIRKRSGVEFVPHDLRRTAASRMTGDLGIARLTVSKVLNHVETGVTATYDRHSYDKEKRAALEAWAQRLEIIIADADNVVRLRRDA
ncbi:MAG: tyrosine-type recombinase/integrase [Alphaproteobacteria bacterium]|nr:tyrosine-type recombinase/integrase [Alphaproteobacteria bacterium]